jgi:rod shape-determining protein MreD
MNNVTPYFVLIIIYYWAIYRPNIMPTIFVFVLGIVFDLVLNYPLGIHAILFIAASLLIKRQRLFFLGQSYIIVWIGFAFSCLATLIVEYLFFFLLSGTFSSLRSLFGSLIITILFFPLVTLLFSFINRILPDTSQKII